MPFIPKHCTLKQVIIYKYRDNAKVDGIWNFLLKESEDYTYFKNEQRTQLIVICKMGLKTKEHLFGRQTILLNE